MAERKKIAQEGGKAAKAKEANASGIIGKKAKPVPKPDKEIGMDADDRFIKSLVDGTISSSVDLNAINNFGSTAQARESVYSLIDTMAQDDRVSAVLETYAEDATDTNENGNVVWCESHNATVAKYITNLLDSLNIDKHAYEWMYSFCKYGDLYLRLYRKSDYDSDPIFGYDAEGRKRLSESRMEEEIRVSIPGPGDEYAEYVEMVPNPGEMFELTKFGKTVGYIQAPTYVQKQSNYDKITSYYTYSLDRGDVTVYGATDFVHATLSNDNTTRTPEEVEIFRNSGKDNEKVVDGKYVVRKGQSLLYNLFRVWRELSLMENTVLLNRITKSALTRILQVEVGDMPDYKVKAVLDFFKNKLEQKTALDSGNSIQEYTNPGPIENIIYTPVHNGQGMLSAQTIGGDYDPKQLTDLNYFLDKFYGGFRVPKQYFSSTDDSTGFNGGTSLSIISSRYGKAVKRIQNSFCQMITDLINILLLDRGLDDYVNKFSIRMQAPITQEELDRRDNARNRMGVVTDIMNQLDGVISDDVIKAKLVKALISQTVSDPEVTNLIQEQITKLESDRKADSKEEEGAEGGESQIKKESTASKASESGQGPDNLAMSLGYDTGSEEEISEPSPAPEKESEETVGETEDSYLPSPNELGVDLTGGE